MGQGEVEIGVERSADQVWAVVADYGGLAEWMPGIDTCELDGDVRRLTTMGMQLAEKLVNKDDDARSLAYSLVEGAPFDRHLATITVHPDGDKSRVTWAFEVEPDAMLDFVKGTYETGIAALKNHCEG